MIGAVYRPADEYFVLISIYKDKKCTDRRPNKAARSNQKLYTHFSLLLFVDNFEDFGTFSKMPYHRTLRHELWSTYYDIIIKLFMRANLLL